MMGEWGFTINESDTCLEAFKYNVKGKLSSLRQFWQVEAL